ncbi:MAG: AAA family ATPase [Candidatus Hydrogenedentes bacterium]|nr:AAA family ATPase [Candidatus Hydrogenedentota bacterium]
MYEKFYGLKEKPFNLTPDPKFLFLSEKHKDAFAHLLYGVKNRVGFVMVTGEIGTGKTTICRALLSQLDPDIEVAFIFNPTLNPVELLRRILIEFKEQPTSDNLLELTDQLNDFLLRKSVSGKNCVLVIDEAQNLTPQVLEQIRLLSNLETDKEKLLQIVLIGQPELQDRLKLYELRQLNQRITARYHLLPLNEEETSQYIAYRLYVAGGKNKVVFTPKAIKLIYKWSKGVPRLINSISDRCLLIGFTQETKEIDHKIVGRAVRELSDQLYHPEEQKAKPEIVVPQRRFSLVSLAFGVFLLLLAVNLWFLPLDELARELRKFNETVLGEGGLRRVSLQAEAKSREYPSVDEDRFDRNLDTNVSGNEGYQAEFDIGLFRVDSNVSMRESALLLLRLWKMALVNDEPSGDTPTELVKFFNENGLSAEVLQPTVAHLLSLNLPSLVQIRSKGDKIWCALVHKKDSTVVLYFDSNNSCVEIPIDSLRAIFENIAIIPWKDESSHKSLSIGSRGEDVKRLKNLLQKGGWLSSDNTTDFYDEETARAVRKLQLEMGLFVDGVAGKQVRLALKRWAGGNVPTLDKFNLSEVKYEVSKQ